MATHAEFSKNGIRTGGGSLAEWLDRWIFVIQAAFFIIVVLVGFIPDSIGKIGAVEAGMRAPFPPILHVHAVLMGSWLLLLLTQSWLMATGKRSMHMQLGVAGMVLAPLLVIAGLVLVPTMYQQTVGAMAVAPPEAMPMLEGVYFFQVNIILAQLSVALIFAVLVFFALRARKTDGDLHKRLMFLATLAPMPAATDRMTWLPTTLPESPLTIYIWMLACIMPLFLWDIYRTRHIHKAYLYFLALLVPTAGATIALWGTPWWMETAPKLLGG